MDMDFSSKFAPGRRCRHPDLPAPGAKGNGKASRTLQGPPMSKLFEPVAFRSVTARNRITVSPMCQYSATDGLGDDWHVQHLGAHAFGGAGIVFTEATHVSAIGRITPGCLGLWSDEHQAFVARLAALIARAGAVPGMQIAHAGRKAACARPWEGGRPVPLAEGGWHVVGPTEVGFYPEAPAPHALSAEELRGIASQFASTARRAREAGFKIVEVHGAHGYLISSFLSPLTNTRNDEYGGDLAGRARLLLEVVDAVRSEWPDELPLFVRLSCADWVPGGTSVEDIVAVAKMLKATGKVDLIDCSSGGVHPDQKLHAYPGYQVPFAEAIRHGAGIATGAVGMIVAPEQAEEIIANGRADLAFIARALLAEPSWPLRAARLLGAKPPLAQPYHRAVLP
jgi:2,4-dienoyl-CoA reductase-like NADH-dependent reductase (Old Yellow Enzyme family)